MLHPWDTGHVTPVGPEVHLHPWVLRYTYTRGSFRRDLCSKRCCFMRDLCSKRDKTAHFLLKTPVKPGGFCIRRSPPVSILKLVIPGFLFRVVIPGFSSGWLFPVLYLRRFIPVLVQSGSLGRVKRAGMSRNVRKGENWPEGERGMMRKVVLPHTREYQECAPPCAH